ncbi:MAG TPA: MarR family transcriptional regulator [Blastocatellia bacterium]|nr:MarR family transcriptional regulator [Blastocatellia bacterium]HMV86374.1 MarR family transcriptional regulator [Blastocatellia bacterium]HMX30313.1 MarR family transcriptional regulator [Blastocatellia bacterium]HMY75958.1 MarR family transcriptional regulator [Blastocatellia bacterium]HMZ20158.1 MarR family transcriptional regulator [Blastocatellia bacterium]
MTEEKKIASSRKAKATDSTESAFNVLVNETSLLFHRLKIVADEVHQQGEMSGALRSILRLLNKHGEQTVPQMARDRAVSRQHVQGLINQLAEAGYVEFIENPAHKRSAFVRLTPLGKKTVATMDRHEDKLLAKSGVGVPDRKMLEAAETLRAVRAFFENKEWQRLLKSLK